jgi:hypothetical protein
MSTGLNPDVAVLPYSIYGGGEDHRKHLSREGALIDCRYDHRDNKEIFSSGEIMR